MRALVDTCVIIDALQDREPFAKWSKKIFIMSANREFSGWISAKSVTDIYYLTHRQTHSDEKTRNILKKIFVLFEILDTTGIDCSQAISSNISDYEDAVMIETAKRSGMDCIVTRNEKDYKQAGLPVYTPEGFVQLIMSENQGGQDDASI